MRQRAVAYGTVVAGMEAVSGASGSIVALGVRVGYLSRCGALLSLGKVAIPELRQLLPEKCGLVPFVACLCLQARSLRRSLLSVVEQSLAVSEPSFGASERGIEILAYILPLIQPGAEALKFLFQLGDTSFGVLDTAASVRARRAAFATASAREGNWSRVVRAAPIAW